MTNFFSEQLAKNDLVAAPMAGISTAPFRKLLRDYHDGLIYTEMVSVEGVRRDNPHSTEFLDMMGEDQPPDSKADRPVVAQFFGGNADSYPHALEVAERYSAPDAYDINMGCPVKKVIKTGGGCALLQDLPKIARIIRSVRKGTARPFSVKIRTGWDDSKPVYSEILDIAQSEGADAIILHARTRTQMFGGVINYDAVAEMASKAAIPVIGNGDVFDYAGYIRMKETGAAGVMIGRAMMHAPWVFAAVRARKDPQAFLTPAQKYDMLMKLYGLMMLHADGDMKKQHHYENIIRKLAVWFSKGLSDAASFRVEVYRDNNVERFINAFQFFKNHPDN